VIAYVLVMVIPELERLVRLGPALQAHQCLPYGIVHSLLRDLEVMSELGVQS